MEQATSGINWEPILWFAGGLGTLFFTVISALLAWIGILYKRGNEKTELIIESHGKHLEKHDEQIHELALSNREQLTLIKHKFKIP